MGYKEEPGPDRPSAGPEPKADFPQPLLVKLMSRTRPRKSETSRPNALERRLVERIRTSGPIPFERFMAAALYDPEHGYYTSGRNVWGREGDYLTAPAVDPALGQAIAGLACELDRALGGGPFDLVEPGCGDGRLAAVVASELRKRAPSLWQRTRFGLVEIGEAARERAVERLGEPPGRGRSAVGDLGELHAGDRPVRGLVYSNELLDALPVERVRLHDGTLERSRIGVHDGRLQERFGPPLPEALRSHLEAAGIELAEGQVAEICTHVGPWIGEVATLLDRGGLLTIDYGHETSTLYGPERLGGTLVTMREYRLGDDPLRDPGERDITAHVDFGLLQRTGTELGFEPAAPCSLRVFLIGMGAVRAGVGVRVGLRHLLVSEIGERHKALLQLRGLTADRIPFGRARLEQPPP